MTIHVYLYDSNHYQSAEKSSGSPVWAENMLLTINPYLVIHFFKKPFLFFELKGNL